MAAHVIPPEFKTPIRTFSSGYSWIEKLHFIKNRIRPSNKHRRLTDPLPKQSVINPSVSPKLKLGFTGDVMPVKDYRLKMDTGLVDFFADTDYLVVNMEGVITDRQRMLALSHRRDIVDYLGALFPRERTIVYVANNHAGDFGYTVFREQYAWLKDQFGYVFGAHDEPALRIGEVNFVAATGLSNQICHYVPWLKDVDHWYDPQAAFNILLPHWGYEMQLNPHPGQIDYAKRLLSKWNLLAGNHSHCPQPVAAYSIENERRAVAYSMGNFCYHHKWPHHRYGKVVKTAIGPGPDGRWQTGDLHWEYTRHQHQPNREMLVHLTPEVRF